MALFDCQQDPFQLDIDKQPNHQNEQNHQCFKRI